MHIEVPNQPVPAQLEAAVATTREEMTKAGVDEREACQQQYDAACTAVREFVESVGTHRIRIPIEVEHEGPAAVEAFVRNGGKTPDEPAPTRKRRAAQES